MWVRVWATSVKLVTCWHYNYVSILHAINAHAYTLYWFFEVYYALSSLALSLSTMLVISIHMTLLTIPYFISFTIRIRGTCDNHTYHSIFHLPSVHVTTVHTMGTIFCHSPSVNSRCSYIPSLTPSVGLAQAHPNNYSRDHYKNIWPPALKTYFALVLW